MPIKKTIDGFDKTLQFAASKNMIVSAIILVAPERAFADKAAGKLFEHPISIRRVSIRCRT